MVEGGFYRGDAEGAETARRKCDCFEGYFSKYREINKGMSVPGYIAGDKGGGLKMPRVEEKRRDSVGIRFSGSVLTGEKSVEQRLRENDIRARMEVDQREREKEEPEFIWDMRDEAGRRLHSH